MTISGIGICPSFVYWYSGNQLATEACYRRRHLQSDGDQFATMSNMGHACLYHVVLDPTILELQTKVCKYFKITEEAPARSYASVHNYSTYPMLLHKCSKNVVFSNEICSK